MKRLLLMLVFALILVSVFASPSKADGVIIPRPIIEQPAPPENLAVRYHRVTVTITNQLAVTHIDQVFYNDSAQELEGDYIFPLPENANISQFVMWVDGKRIEARVLEADEARQIYEEIVRNRRDPALLEYVGRNAFRARVYPILPYSETRIEIEYSEALASDGGLIKYVYPLNTEKFSSKPLEQVSVSVVISSSKEIKAVYSPSHDISLSRQSSFQATASYEENGVTPNKDFVLYYGLSDEALGVNLLSYKNAAEDGYWLLLVAPPAVAQTDVVAAKDVILVLDTSGSMRGEKMDQARRAADYVLSQLAKDDRFNIIWFSTDVRQFREQLVPASQAADARTWLLNLSARGGTNISRALETALAYSDSGRPQLVLFLTDGLPTEGVIDSQTIVDSVNRLAKTDTRLFVFGVGDDVNTFLLDRLAEDHRGASVYVRPGQNIDTEVTALYNKIGQPLLTDVTLQILGAETHSVYPYPLPDLFLGSQTSIAGRYRDGGTVTVIINGKVNGRQVSYTYEQQVLAEAGGEELVPRIWATRKIGYLLTQIRLHGADRELVDEIVELSLRHGIITPYTSFLIDETEDVLAPAGRQEAAERIYNEAPASASEGAGAAAVGADAVQKSVVQQELRDAEVAGDSTGFRVVGDRSFILRDGTWTDTRYLEGMAVQQVLFASPRYFQLLEEHPDWGRCLALGSDVLIVS